MKFLPSILLILLGGLVAFALFKACEEPETVDNSEEIAIKDREYAALNDSLELLKKENDSLRTSPGKIQTKVITKIREIQVEINKDSSKSIVYFREGLTLWGYLPDGTDYPTYKEFGFASEIFQEGYGLKLEVPVLNEVIANLDKQITQWEDKEENWNEIRVLYSESNESLMNQLEDAYSFWRSPILFYGLGVITAIAVIFVSNL